MPDLSSFERLVILPVTGLMFLLGIYPQLVIGVINNTVLQMVEQLKF
jgi:NADH-quinone oxidoreductase subunit M